MISALLLLTIILAGGDGVVTWISIGVAILLASIRGIMFLRNRTKIAILLDDWSQVSDPNDPERLNDLTLHIRLLRGVGNLEFDQLTIISRVGIGSQQMGRVLNHSNKDKPK